MLDSQPSNNYQKPKFPWLVSQHWENVLFLHWSVPVEELQIHIPKILDLELFNGQAWIGIVLFKVKRFRPHFLPPIPIFSSFNEINVRTYVNYKGKPGVYFFTLDTDSRLTVNMAKLFYSLPYRLAKIESKMRNRGIEFISNEKSSRQSIERFKCVYKPDSPVYYSQKGTLDYWLTERYCLWAMKRDRLIRVDIQHKKWGLQEVKATIEMNSLASFLPCSIFEAEPYAHFSREKQAFLWPPVYET